MISTRKVIAKCFRPSHFLLTGKIPATTDVIRRCVVTKWILLYKDTNVVLLQFNIIACERQFINAQICLLPREPTLRRKCKSSSLSPPPRFLLIDHRECIAWLVEWLWDEMWQRNGIYLVARLKKFNKIQLYADIYVLLNYCTCFGRPSRPSSGVHKTVAAASGTHHTIWGASLLKRDQQSRLSKLATHIVWCVPEAATTVLCTPDDGRDGRPKHVQ